MQTVIVDHYDSFTYNLFQLIAQIQGVEPLVISHDSDEFLQLDPAIYDNIVLSPGPGNPDNPHDFKIGKSIILNSDKPILGVCLGHQGIFSAFGGRIERAPTPMHGCVSKISHNQDALYHSIPTPFQVMRYHSLVCTGPVPVELEVTAWTQDGLIMGLRHLHKPIWGIQYHPESIASEYGRQLLINFQHLTSQYYQQRRQTLPSQTKQLSAKPPYQPASLESPPSDHDSYTILSHKHPFHGDPAGVFQQIFAQYPSAVWLDSSQVVPRFSRFSYMGALQGPLAYQLRYDAHSQTTCRIQGQDTTTFAMSIFAYLKQALQSIEITSDPTLPFDFHGGFIGYFGYELSQETASIPNTKPAPHPDAQWLFLDRFIAFDHQEQCCYVVAISSQDHLASNTTWLQTLSQTLQNSNELLPSSLPPYPVQGSWLQAPADYKSRIQDCLDYIDAGDSYEICLTNKLQFACQIDPLRYYINLRHCHPAPHAAFFKFSDLAIACSSMERFLKIDQHRQIEAKPIKGTLPRGQDPVEDQQFKRALQEDIKFRSEHLMIVDLLRNDLGKICQIGSVTVPDLMQVETYATVHQLVSRITGQLRTDVHGIDCIQHTFPGGSMTGAPKIRTITLLNQFETQARGIYSGSLGYISLNGAIDLNIVIRTAEITPQQISIGAGGAIVALSDIEEEFEEMVLKTRALQTALGVTLHEQDRFTTKP